MTEASVTSVVEVDIKGGPTPHAPPSRADPGDVPKTSTKEMMAIFFISIGGCVFSLFLPATRQHYDLEGLWTGSDSSSSRMWTHADEDEAIEDAVKAAQEAGFADRVGREVVMEHEVFPIFAFQCIDDLFILSRT